MSGLPRTFAGCVTHPDILWRRKVKIALISVDRLPDDRTLAINADRSSLVSGSFMVFSLIGLQ